MTSTPVSSKPVTVLLVDDHPVVRNGYRRLLESTPDIQVVAEAEDGETACDRYAEYTPDVVILDLNMPGIGGLETIRRIKAGDPAARILMFTMHDSETLIMRSLAAGATGYLSKHSGVGQMARAVREVARGVLFIDPERTASVISQQLSAGENPLLTLSPREFQCFQLLAEGHSVNEIATTLSISPKTAGVHHANIMRKLELQNTTQLVRLALRHKVIQL